MFEGDKHRGNSALKDDCGRIPEVLKDVFMKKGNEEVWDGIEQ